MGGGISRYRDVAVSYLESGHGGVPGGEVLAMLRTHSRRRTVRAAVVFAKWVGRKR